MLYLNLCDTCSQCFGACSGLPEFPADGKNGDDNVIACDGYTPTSQKVDDVIACDDWEVEQYNATRVIDDAFAAQLKKLNKEQAAKLAELGYHKLNAHDIDTLERARKLAYDRGRVGLKRDIDAVLDKFVKK